MLLFLRSAAAAERLSIIVRVRMWYSTDTIRAKIIYSMRAGSETAGSRRVVVEVETGVPVSSLLVSLTIPLLESPKIQAEIV